MKISVIGTGYVGLTTGLCLSSFRHKVTCIDVNQEKIDTLNKGIMTIYEPGLDQVLKNSLKNKKIIFSTNYDSLSNDDVIVVAVGTPVSDDGSANLTYLERVIDIILETGHNLQDKKQLIIIRSTVPVGTCDQIYQRLDLEKYDLAFNPEFLREGSALNDFMNPDRIIFGYQEKDIKSILEAIYKPLLKKTDVVHTEFKSAEMIKYGANCYLAMRIAFANEIAKISDIAGANGPDVLKAIGLDKRIGSNYFSPGPGFGGSCFPKDLKSMEHQIDQHQVNLPILESIFDSNEKHKSFLIEKVHHIITKYKIKNLAVLGITFKANTDDLRESPALTVISGLLYLKINMKFYDPAYKGQKIMVGDEDINIAPDIINVLTGSDAVLILTEWDEFKDLEQKFKALLKNKLVIDLRNIYNRQIMQELKIHYYGVGF